MGCKSGNTEQTISSTMKSYVLTATLIYIYIKSYDKCKMSCSGNCFTVSDTASSYNHLKIKEALHIMSEIPFLNKQVKHFYNSNAPPLLFTL